jgi:hypothetical protein
MPLQYFLFGSLVVVVFVYQACFCFNSRLQCHLRVFSGAAPLCGE